MKTITAAMLVKAGACHDQLDLFRKTFPRGCRLTLANVQKALSVGLNVEWAVFHFATVPALDTYDAAIKPARDAYDAAIKPARDAYDAAIKPALDAYDAAIQSPGDAYAAAIKPARDAYNAAIQSAQDTYDAAIAPHALRALLED